MAKRNLIYRPRGIYKPTGRRVWITKVWFEERSIARSVAGSQFKNIEIVREDEIAMHRRGLNPRVERRI